MTNPIEVHTRVSFICPFCGMRAEVIEPPGVLHEQPACETFMKLEPTDYLHVVNQRLRETGRGRIS